MKRIRFGIVLGMVLLVVAAAPAGAAPAADVTPVLGNSTAGASCAHGPSGVAMDLLITSAQRGVGDTGLCGAYGADFTSYCNDYLGAGGVAYAFEVVKNMRGTLRTASSELAITDLTLQGHPLEFSYQIGRRHLRGTGRYVETVDGATVATGTVVLDIQADVCASSDGVNGALALIAD